MNSEPDIFRIQRDKVAECTYWSTIVFLLVVGILSFGIGFIVAIIYAYTVGKWLPQRQADALRYWLDGSTLRVEQGVYFLKRKAIPLDRVTDVMLSQGPVLRRFDLWFLHIQTAGAGGQAMAEAILVGLENPEDVRDELLKARDASRKNAV